MSPCWHSGIVGQSDSLTHFVSSRLQRSFATLYSELPLSSRIDPPMESLARDDRYDSGPKRPSTTQFASSTLNSSKTEVRSPKKLKRSKREKKKARSLERELGVTPGVPFEPPSSQKRMKLEPAMYRALLEAASPRRRKDAAAGASSSTTGQQQQARPTAPRFRKIQRPMPPPPFYPSPTQADRYSHPTQDEVQLSPIRSHALFFPPSQAHLTSRPTVGPDNRDATPLFLPEFDDELAGRIIARGEARERATAAAQRDDVFSTPSRNRQTAANASASSSSSANDDDDGDSDQWAGDGDDYERERFPDRVSEMRDSASAEAGPSPTPFVHVFATDDEDDIEGTDGEDLRRSNSEGSPTETSPNAPGTSERSLNSLDLLAVPTNVPGAIPVSVQAAQAAAAAATAALKSNSKKGKKRAAPPADETDPAAAPRKITRNRESYQAKTTAMWVREQCLTPAEADERWERFLLGRGGHKGQTYKLAMKQRESLLVGRWMVDDEISFDQAQARMRALVDRDERDKVARQKAARVSQAAHAPPETNHAAPPSPAKRARATRKGRTSAANAAAVASTAGVPKPTAHLPSKASTPSTAHTPARRKGPISTTTRAVELLCATEGERSAEARLTIIDLFSASDNSAEVYLSLPDSALRAAWVERRLREKGGA